MMLRHGLLLGLGVALAVGPAVGASPPKKQPASKPAGDTAVAQTTAVPGQPAVPRTLAEALAAAYSSQPALLAERARLRSTDENVPQALSGWRPTVVMAGTAGYGDGMSRLFSGGSGGFINAQTDRL